MLSVIVTGFVAAGLLMIGMPSAIFVRRLQVSLGYKAAFLCLVGAVFGYVAIWVLIGAGEIRWFGSLGGLTTASIWCLLNMAFLNRKQVNV